MGSSGDPSHAHMDIGECFHILTCGITELRGDLDSRSLQSLETPLCVPPSTSLEKGSESLSQQSAAEGEPAIITADQIRSEEGAANASLDKKIGVAVVAMTTKSQVDTLAERFLRLDSFSQVVQDMIDLVRTREHIEGSDESSVSAVSSPLASSGGIVGRLTSSQQARPSSALRSLLTRKVRQAAGHVQALHVALHTLLDDSEAVSGGKALHGEQNIPAQLHLMCTEVEESLQDVQNVIRVVFPRPFITAAKRHALSALRRPKELGNGEGGGRTPSILSNESLRLANLGEGVMRRSTSSTLLSIERTPCTPNVYDDNCSALASDVPVQEGEASILTVSDSTERCSDSVMSVPSTITASVRRATVSPKMDCLGTCSDSPTPARELCSNKMVNETPAAKVVLAEQLHVSRSAELYPTLPRVPMPASRPPISPATCARSPVPPFLSHSVSLLLTGRGGEEELFFDADDAVEETDAGVRTDSGQREQEVKVNVGRADLSPDLHPNGMQTTFHQHCLPGELWPLILKEQGEAAVLDDFCTDILELFNYGEEVPLVLKEDILEPRLRCAGNLMYVYFGLVHLPLLTEVEIDLKLEFSSFPTLTTLYMRRLDVQKELEVTKFERSLSSRNAFSTGGQLHPAEETLSSSSTTLEEGDIETGANIMAAPQLPLVLRTSESETPSGGYSLRVPLAYEVVLPGSRWSSVVSFLSESAIREMLTKEVCGLLRLTPDIVEVAYICCGSTEATFALVLRDSRGAETKNKLQRHSYPSLVAAYEEVCLRLNDHMEDSTAAVGVLREAKPENPPERPHQRRSVSACDSTDEKGAAQAQRGGTVSTPVITPKAAQSSSSMQLQVRKTNPRSKQLLRQATVSPMKLVAEPDERDGNCIDEVSQPTPRQHPHPMPCANPQQSVKVADYTNGTTKQSPATISHLDDDPRPSNPPVPFALELPQLPQRLQRTLSTQSLSSADEPRRSVPVPTTAHFQQRQISRGVARAMSSASQHRASGQDLMRGAPDWRGKRHPVPQTKQTPERRGRYGVSPTPKALSSGNCSGRTAT